MVIIKDVAEYIVPIIALLLSIYSAIKSNKVTELERKINEYDLKLKEYELEKIEKEYLNYPGVTHWSEFQSYYRKSQFRYYVKKLLGDGFVSLYRKVRYGG